MEIVHKSVDSVSGLIKEIPDLAEHQRLLFRGHDTTEYKILPTCARPHTFLTKSKVLNAKDERDIFERFRRRSHDLLGAQQGAGKALLVARHHGLPVRLIDWTSNPLAALFFACCGKENNDAHLWAIRRRRNIRKYEFADLFEIGETAALFRKMNNTATYLRVIDPVYNSDRIRAQDGYFTVHGPRGESLESVFPRLTPKNSDFDRVICWTIAKDRKLELIQQLSQLGVTRRTVYPDLDGIAKSIVETEILWRGKKLGRK